VKYVDGNLIVLLENHRKKEKLLLLLFYLWAAKVKQGGEAVNSTDFPYCFGPSGPTNVLRLKDQCLINYW
jgi:hypothetical protein